MTFCAVLIALMLQAAPKASVAGVVVNANGEPIPNIRVSLGRMDVPLGAFAQMVAGERPPREMTLSAETLAMIGEQMAAELAGGAVPPEAAASAAAFKALPVADIHELVVTPAGSMVVITKSSPPTMTDDRGRFAFNDVTPGTYKLMFAGDGYAKQDYGQRTAAGGVPMALTAGQAKTDIVMRLSPVSAVSGRIRDAAGQAVAGVPVQLFRFAYNETGKRNVERVTAVRTDDRGEYRMYYLTPGRYYLSAGNQPGQEQQSLGMSGLEALLFGGGYSTANRISQNYAVMYYPGTADEGSAAPIDVPPGADLRGIDLLLSPQQSYRVRGRVVDSRTGQPPQTPSLSITVQNSDPLTGGFFNAGNPNYKAVDGSFEYQNVSAGSYSLSASLPNLAQSQQRPPDFANMSPAEQQAYFESQRMVDLARPKASATVKVVNADVDGVLLTLGVASSLSGRLRMETNAPDADSLRFIRIQLGGAATYATDPMNGGPQPRPVGADGTFRIDNVWPGEYRVFVNGLPPGSYVKEARLGDADLLNGPLRLTGPDSRPLDILISPNVGTIDGAVVDATGQPIPGAQVVLIPNRSRERTELFRPVLADSSGRFKISDVAPGEYTLAAWEGIEPFAFFDPNLIRQAEGSGKAVRVSESSNQTVNVTPIPLR